MSDWTSWFEETEAGLSADELRAIEAAIGVAIPPDIRELWEQVARGRFKRGSIESSEGVAVHARELLAVRKAPRTPPRPQLPSGFVEWYAHWVPEELEPWFFPFAGALGGILGVDTRDASVKVYFFDTAWERVRPVAPSFGAFMGALVDEPIVRARRRRR